VKDKTITRKSDRREIAMAANSRYALNAICPYFTMFPLEYPMRVLDPKRLLTFKSPLVCDPYCGRGTSIYAARLRGVRVRGIDIEPVAVAIARAKIARATLVEVMDLFDELIAEPNGSRVPNGPFWRWAYHENTLRTLCRVRKGLLGRRSDPAAILRAVMMGAMHGPLPKSPERASYFSNQMPRTFAPKPDYSIGYWKDRKLQPVDVNIRAIVERRTQRALAHDDSNAKNGLVDIRCNDSRRAEGFADLGGNISHVVTSPPYYGLRTYAQDQWLRGWFIGKDSQVDYRSDPGLNHGSPALFAQSLSQVWNQIGSRASERIEMFVRFGGISSRAISADEILRESLALSDFDWSIVTRHDARSSEEGKRQALQMTAKKAPVEESDYVIRLRQ
jgi:hypothetical protein